jgi:DNA-binding CsgD family transcriptional regulator
MNDNAMDMRSRRMLELLATGAGSRAIAKEMGYQEGTMRVYLHNLYRKIGVRNKTEAVIWHLKRTAPVKEAPPVLAAAKRHDDPLGDMALAEGLHAALGIMGIYLGPYGRVWEVGARLSGQGADAQKDGHRARSRRYWNALLRGDFAVGKQSFDEDEGEAVMAQAPSDAVLLASLLALGGYSNAARHVASKLTDRRRARASVPAREAILVRLVMEALETKVPQAITRLHKAASDHAAQSASRQLAMVLLFHTYRARRELERARQVASAIWAEAEEARKDLAATGDRALGGKPLAAAIKAATREKAVAAVR